MTIPGDQILDATGLFQLMDNAAYIQETDTPPKQDRIPMQIRNDQEVRVVTVTTGNGNQRGGPSPSAANVCRPDVCRRARSSYTATQSDSPWHKTKTHFLIGTIALLCIWIIIYSILSSMHIL